MSLWDNYYDWDGQSLEQIISLWQVHGKKLFDEYRQQPIYPIKDLLKYREYIWNSEHFRDDDKYYNELKESIAKEGIRSPIIFEIGKMGARVGEGNHRIAIAQELGIEEVPVRFVFRSDKIENASDLNKIAWPWIGSTEGEMGSMSGAFRDVNQSPYTSYDSLVSEKHLTDATGPSVDYGESRISPVDGDGWDKHWELDLLQMEPLDSSNYLLQTLEKGSTILDVGCGTGEHSDLLSENGFGVVAIDISKEALDRISGSYDKINDDIVTYKFNKKFDAFQALSSLENINDYPSALKNIYEHLRPLGIGLIHIENDKVDLMQFKRAIHDAGFEIEKESSIAINKNGQEVPYIEFIVKKSEIDKTAKIDIFNGQDKVASFNCDVAKTIGDKIAGLQAYDAISKNSGLLFEYKRPEDVIYHMGSVKYPIDIIFIDNNHNIKKIYKNIQPGDLAIFGCSGVKNVLEIYGGLCDKLNIQTGSSIRLSVPSAKSMIKEASFRNRENMRTFNIIHAYYFDEIILRNPKIFLNKVASYNEDNICLDIEGNVFTPGEEIESDISNMSKLNDFKIKKSISGGLRSFVENSKEAYTIYKEIKYSLSKKDAKVVFATNLENPQQCINTFITKLEMLYGPISKRAFINFIKLETNSNHINYIENLRALNPNIEIRLYADESLTKSAGVPIPDSIKNKSREVLKFLDMAGEHCRSSIDNMNLNLEQYEKIAGDPQSIKNTKGLYHQSIKRNIDVAKKYLLSVRDAIKILNEIKDATTTMEIIEGLAYASQTASDSIQELFDLINVIDSMDFVQQLADKTSQYENHIEDLEANIERAKDYINTNILGIIVLSG